jgi:integrase
MSHYPEKRGGVPTGRHRVEVQIEGKRHIRYVHSAREASALDKRMQAGIIDTPTPPTQAQGYSTDDLYRDCVHRWEAGKDKQGVARFRVTCDTLREALGGTPLREVTLDHIDRWASLILTRTGKTERHRSRATLARYLAPLSWALDWADDRGRIAKRPRLKGYWPKPSKAVKFHLTEDMQARQREALFVRRPVDGDTFALLMDVQIASGTRISELIKLTPTDLEPGTGDKAHWLYLSLADTKNGGHRKVPIPMDLGRRLEALVARGLPAYHIILKVMKGSRRIAGLPTTQPTHAHRHTTATRMTARGVPTAVVQEFLGHANIKTTLGYIEANTEAKEGAASMLLADAT